MNKDKNYLIENKTEILDLINTVNWIENFTTGNRSTANSKRKELMSELKKKTSEITESK